MPIISVDLNPGRLGIPAERTVFLGQTFSVALVFTGDGLAAFDTFAFDVGFNDAGAVLALAAGTENPVAGAVAGTAPLEALDIFGLVPVVEGGALTAFAADVPASFGGNTGALGIQSFALPFNSEPFGVGQFINLLSLMFVANDLGTSTVAGSAVPDLGSPVLALTVGFDQLEVPVRLHSALVTVVEPPPTVIPEPGTLALLGTGLVLLCRRAKRLGGSARR
ncbi:MAG: PEP-CTERM sorting domain-containing protein [Deferrisomatales bacterium]